MGWLVTTTLAQPFQRFLQLRQDAALSLAEYEHSRLWTGNPEEEPPTKEWLEKRSIAYDKAGTALVAFTLSNSIISRLLYNKLLGPYRCYVRSAGEGLRTLALALPRYSSVRHQPATCARFWKADIGQPCLGPAKNSSAIRPLNFFERSSLRISLRRLGHLRLHPLHGANPRSNAARSFSINSRFDSRESAANPQSLRWNKPVDILIATTLTSETPCPSSHALRSTNAGRTPHP